MRVQGKDFLPPLIICNVEHRFLIAEQMREAGIKPQSIVLEPVGRNTAPAAAIAALTIAEKDPDGVILLMPADHIVRNGTAFLRAVGCAVAAAQRDHLVTFAITPDLARDRLWLYPARHTAGRSARTFPQWPALRREARRRDGRRLYRIR